jgi:hypothetical protein
MKRAVATILLVLLAMAGCKRGPSDRTAKPAFEIDKVYERGPLTAHVRLDKAKISIAETVLLQLEATTSGKYQVQMPKVDEALLTNFGLVSWDNLGRKLDPNNNVATTYQYRLEPFLSGKFDIPAFTFVFQDVNDPNSRHEVASEPISVEVTSLLGEDRVKLTIGDIEGVVEIPAKTSWWGLWLTGGSAVVIGPLVWWLVRRKRTREQTRIFQPAHELAYARLRALVAEGLVEAGRVKEFYERISAILRHYIEDRFDLRAPERTTEEFLYELGRTDVLAPPDKQTLQEFLTHCDLVKFAKHAPTTEQIQQSFDLVKTFVEKTKSDDRKIDVTDKMKAEQATQAEVA